MPLSLWFGLDRGHLKMLISAFPSVNTTANNFVQCVVKKNVFLSEPNLLNKCDINFLLNLCRDIVRMSECPAVTGRSFQSIGIGISASHS